MIKQHGVSALLSGSSAPGRAACVVARGDVGVEYSTGVGG